MRSVREAIILGDPYPGLLKTRAGSSFRENWVTTPGWKRGLEWRLESYGNCVNNGIGHILAAQAIYEAEPFLSHPYFMAGVTTANYNFYTRREALAGEQAETPMDPLDASLNVARMIFRSPESVSIEDVAFTLGRRSASSRSKVS